MKISVATVNKVTAAITIILQIKELRYNFFKIGFLCFLLQPLS